MKLKLHNLQNIVNRVIEEEKLLPLLKEEITKSFGPSIVIEDREIDDICDDVMEQLDLLDALNKEPGKFKNSMAIKMLEHQSVDVRRLGARLAPINQLYKVANDKSQQVRSVVAKRIDLSSLKEMIRRFPTDDNLRFIFEVRKEDESNGFDMYGDNRLGKLAKQQDDQELTDLWYESLARDLVEQYRHQTEGSWKQIAVNRYVSSVKATSGLEVDSEKLLEAIDDVINEREEELLSSHPLKETKEYLNHRDLFESTYYTMGEEDFDDVTNLVNSGLGVNEYINSALKVFSIKEGTVPRAVSRFVLMEGVEPTSFTVPKSGMLPHSEGFRSVDEKALDMYVQRWNKRRSLERNPTRISWSIDPNSYEGIIFDVSVK